MTVAQSHSQWLWSHSQSHPHPPSGCGVDVGVAPHAQPLGVALGHSHYPKLEGGLESGGFQSESTTSIINHKHDNMNYTISYIGMFGHIDGIYDELLLMVLFGVNHEACLNDFIIIGCFPW